MVRAYYPQRTNGSITVNSSYPSQGIGSAQILILKDVMAYDDTNVFGYDSTAFNWFDTDWEHRIPVVIKAGQVLSPQTNFPFTINSTFSELIGKTIAELRFAKNDKILLNYEIEKFDNSTGELVAHMLLPTMDNFDAINIYYDNPGASDAQNPFSLWSDYENVYHLNNNPSGPNTILDSTVQQNDGTPTAVTSVPAKIGDGLEFNAASFPFVLFSNCEINFDFTISIWYKTTQVVDGDLVSIVDLTLDNQGVLVENNPDGSIRYLVREPPGGIGGVDALSGVGFNDDEFHLLHLTFDSINNVQQLIIDGVLEDSLANTQNLLSGFKNCLLGKLKVSTSQRNFDGILDEFRIFRGIYDTDKALTEFNNQNNPEEFYAIGKEETFSTITDRMAYDD